MSTETDNQAELALDEQAQKDDFAAKIEAQAEDQNDPNDLNHKGEDEDGVRDEPVKAEEVEPVKAETDKEEPEDEKAELEQLRKTAKALGKRVSVLSREKRELSTKLQESIKAVPKAEDEPVEGEEQPQRSDYKSKAEFDSAVATHAQMLREQEKFNERCNDVESKGAAAFKDKWVRAKADLASLDDNGRIPLDILSVALETDNPALVLFKLGNDLEMASELMGMTPIKRAIAMDKLATAKAAPVQSKAPAPVEPIGGKGGRDDAPRDTDSDEEWNRKEAIRERKVAEARRRERGY